MIGCRRWFVGGTKDEHLPHDSATGDRGLRAAVLVVRDHKKGTRIVRCTSYHPSASRKCIHSEPRFRVLLTEGYAEHLALEWTRVPFLKRYGVWYPKSYAHRPEVRDPLRDVPSSGRAQVEWPGDR